MFRQWAYPRKHAVAVRRHLASFQDGLHDGNILAERLYACILRILKFLQKKFYMGFLTIEWSEEDVKETLKAFGKECSIENIKKMISAENVRCLEEKSIELGWGILHSVAEQI